MFTVPAARKVVLLALFLLVSLCGFAFLYHPTALAQDLQTVKVHPAAYFSTGWTHVVPASNGTFCYSAATGAGVFGRMDDAASFSSIKVFPANSFTRGWTHIVDTRKGVLFYNAKDGAGVIASFDQGGWTHVTAAGDQILWYKSDTGAVVITRIG
jgi:hypothetical protein